MILEGDVLVPENSWAPYEEWQIADLCEQSQRRSNRRRKRGLYFRDQVATLTQIASGSRSTHPRKEKKMERFFGIDPGVTTGVADVTFSRNDDGSIKVEFITLMDIRDHDTLREVLHPEVQAPTFGVYVEQAPTLHSNAKAAVQAVEEVIKECVGEFTLVRPADWKPNKRAQAFLEGIVPQQFGGPSKHAKDALGIAAYGMWKEGMHRAVAA